MISSVTKDKSSTLETKKIIPPRIFAALIEREHFSSKSLIVCSVYVSIAEGQVNDIYSVTL